MSTVRTRPCQAKDPVNCRYHSPNAGTVAYFQYIQAFKAYDNATSFDEKEKAKKEMDVASDVYDATANGMAHLEKTLRTARQEGQWQESIGLTMRLLKAKSAVAEERQTGATTESQFIEEGDMTAKLDAIQSHISAGGSDHYLDVYDRYEPALKDAVFEYDTFKFINAYNSLVNDLAVEGAEANWIDVNRGRQWVKDTENLKFKGKFFRSKLQLDNTTGSISFTA